MTSLPKLRPNGLRPNGKNGTNLLNPACRYLSRSARVGWAPTARTVDRYLAKTDLRGMVSDRKDGALREVCRDRTIFKRIEVHRKQGIKRWTTYGPFRSTNGRNFRGIFLSPPRVDGTRFRIENPMTVEKWFFRHDPSSAYGVDRKSYNAWILVYGQNTQWFHRLIVDDIRVINGSNMHMRAPLRAWAGLTTGGIPFRGWRQLMCDERWKRYGGPVATRASAYLECYC